MKKTILTFLTLFLAQAAASKDLPSDLKFDEGLTLETVVKRIEESELKKISNPKFNLLIDITKDCKRITFTRDYQLTSEPVSLTSVEFATDCQVLGYAGNQVCFTYTRYHKAESKIIITAPRKLKPGKPEVFELCLWNDSLSLRQLSPAAGYSVNPVRDTFELTPAARTTPEISKSQGKDCALVSQADYSCIYRCKDGSFLSQLNPSPPFPGTRVPLHDCPQDPDLPL